MPHAAALCVKHRALDPQMRESPNVTQSHTWADRSLTGLIPDPQMKGKWKADPQMRGKWKADPQMRQSAALIPS